MKILHLPSVKGQNLHVYIIQNINFSRTLGVSGNPYFTTSLRPSHPSPSQEKMYFLSKKFDVPKLYPPAEKREERHKVSYLLIDHKVLRKFFSYEMILFPCRKWLFLPVRSKIDMSFLFLVNFFALKTAQLFLSQNLSGQKFSLFPLLSLN